MSYFFISKMSILLDMIYWIFQIRSKMHFSPCKTRNYVENSRKTAWYFIYKDQIHFCYKKHVFVNRKTVIMRPKPFEIEIQIKLDRLTLFFQHVLHISLDLHNIQSQTSLTNKLFTLKKLKKYPCNNRFAKISRKLARPNKENNT